MGGTNYKTCLNQEGINNFNNCVVLAIQLIVLVCFYYRTTTVLGCVVHNRVMFYKNAPSKNQTNRLLNPSNFNTSD